MEKGLPYIFTPSYLAAKLQNRAKPEALTYQIRNRCCNLSGSKLKIKLWISIVRLFTGTPEVGGEGYR